MFFFVLSYDMFCYSDLFFKGENEYFFCVFCILGSFFDLFYVFIWIMRKVEKYYMFYVEGV